MLYDLWFPYSSDKHAFLHSETWSNMYFLASPPPAPTPPLLMHFLPVLFVLLSFSFFVFFLFLLSSSSSSSSSSPFPAVSLLSFLYLSLSLSPFMFLSFSEGARKTHRAPPPPPLPQEPSTMVPKCTSGCPEHNLTCSLDRHWDALELQPFAQRYPLAFTRALAERRSLMHHLNHFYIILLR